jgi:hypothetical protein
MIVVQDCITLFRRSLHRWPPQSRCSRRVDFVRTDPRHPVQRKVYPRRWSSMTKDSLLTLLQSLLEYAPRDEPLGLLSVACAAALAIYLTMSRRRQHARRLSQTDRAKRPSRRRTQRPRTTKSRR